MTLKLMLMVHFYSVSGTTSDVHLIFFLIWKKLVPCLSNNGTYILLIDG